MEIITSASNKIVKYIRALHSKKGRAAADAFLVEGAKFVGEIAAPWEIEFMVFSASYAKGKNMSKYGNCPFYIVADRIFPSLVDATSPQGVFAVVKQRKFAMDDIFATENPLLLLLEEINDPGNLGTMLRIAHALGLSGLALSENCADVYSPKVIRSSAGSVFHVPFVIAPLARVAHALAAHNVAIFAATASAQNPLYNLDFTRPAAFLIGNEARGLSREALQLTNTHVKIPIFSESLNASVACAMLAYEAFRQRLKGF